MKSIHILASIISLFLLLEGCNTRSIDKKAVVVFYNCENLFDTINAPGKNDDEFTPTGALLYTRKKYEHKLHNMATVLLAMSEDKQNYAAVIGVAEVENEQVLSALTQQPEIARVNYKYVIADGHDDRGINVGLLYDPARFYKISSNSIPIKNRNSILATRDILYVCGKLDNDTIHLFVNHWPSRRNDDDENDIPNNNRMLAAQQMKQLADSITRKKSGAKIIVMGDFNDNPTDTTIVSILNATNNREHISPTALYNPWTEIYKGGTGTEYYDKTWNLFDQIMLNGNLANNPAGMHFSSARICHYTFMTDTGQNKQGTPLRSFKGPYWNNGYSDHFPVMLYLEK